MEYKVYLICANYNDEILYKIGYTRTDVNKRIKQLKTGNPYEFKIMGVFESKWGSKIEAVLHRKYKRNRIDGEWFRLDISDVENFNNDCRKVHDGLEVVSNTLYFKNRKSKVF